MILVKHVSIKTEMAEGRFGSANGNSGILRGLVAAKNNQQKLLKHILEKLEDYHVD